jgi:hypothetical protein
VRSQYLAEQRIKELEDGTQAEFFDVITVITDNKKMSQILADMANSVANEMLSPCELLGLYYHPFLRSIWEVVSKQLIVPSSAPLQGRV